MPSHLHEILIKMFRDRPVLVADLLADPLGVVVPTFHTARLSSSELTDIPATEYRADAVVTLDVAAKPVFAVVVEVQLSPNQQKRYRWPMYVASLYARLECPTILLVVSPDPAVAAWCAKPIVITDPGLTLTPIVLGPQRIPLVTDASVARGHPELTVLSTIAHGAKASDPSPMFRALLAALDAIDLDHASLYTDLILTVLPAATRIWLEEFMTTEAQQRGSEFADRYITRFEREGMAKGMAKGEAVGMAKGEAVALLTILDARGIHVPDDIRADVTACTDTAQLETWIRRAVTAEKIQDLLD